MSDLKRFIRALGRAIIYYHEIQTQVKEPTDLLEQSFEEWLLQLPQMIKEATTEYSARTPLLEYLLHLINTLGPRVEQFILIEESHWRKIEEDLVEFVLNMQKLMQVSHRTTIGIQYGEMSIAMLGFMQVPLLKPCISGQAIDRTIFCPFELAFDTPEFEVRRKIQKIIAEHRKEMFKINCLQAKNKKLAEENLKLTQQVQDL